MGKSDTYSKDLLQNNIYFADTINNSLFDGDVVINPKELQELDPTELHIVEDLSKDNIPIQRYRDVLKQAVIRMDDKAIYAIIGIESQTYIHYAMPIKNLLYDAMRYAKQVKQQTKVYRNNKTKLDSEEFLSGWKKTDKLKPVITLTIYFGTKSWDGPLSIYEMLEDGLDEHILNIISDYKIHLLEPTKVKDWGKYKSDIGLLYQVIAESNKDEGIIKLIRREPERFSGVDNSIVRAINFYTDSDFKVNQYEEVTNMCYATKTADVSSMLRAYINIGLSFDKIFEAIRKYYPSDDEDITDAYIKEKYDSLLREKND